MRKRVLASGAAIILLLSLLASCGQSAATSALSSDGSSILDSSNASTSSSTETKKENRDQGALGDYYVKISGIETGLKDYDGNSLIGIFYKFTNKGKGSISFDSAVFPQAFQDGVELEDAYPDNPSDKYNNSTKNIKTGITLTCEEYYVLTSKKSAVEVDVSEFFSFEGDNLTKTFQIK